MVISGVSSIIMVHVAERVHPFLARAVTPTVVVDVLRSPLFRSVAWRSPTLFSHHPLMGGGIMRNVLTLGVLVLFSLVVACSKQPETPPVGIIGALPQEVEAVKTLIKTPTEEKVHGKIVTRGTIHGTSVVLVESGMGKVNAAATTQMLVTKYGAKEIVFSGVAGGVNPQSEVGDVIIAEQVAQHDYGIVTPAGKKSWRPGTLTFDAVPLSALWYSLSGSGLFQRLRQVATNVDLGVVPAGLREGNEKPSIRFGTVVTGDEFIASEEKRKWLETTFGADATEMEGGAFAQVCESNHVDCVIIRTVSDLANESSHVDFPKFATYAAQNSAAMISALFQAPSETKNRP